MRKRKRKKKGIKTRGSLFRVGGTTYAARKLAQGWFGETKRKDTPLPKAQKRGGIRGNAKTHTGRNAVRGN